MRRNRKLTQTMLEYTLVVAIAILALLACNLFKYSYGNPLYDGLRGHFDLIRQCINGPEIMALN